MAGNVNGLAIASIAIGGVMAWSGIENQTIANTLKSVLSGEVPTAGAGADISVAPSSAAASDTESGNASSEINASTPGGGTNAQNAALGKLLAAGYGWATGVQWTALNNVAMRESGWNNQIYNGGQVGGAYEPNKAYGIAQALGHGPDGAPYPAGNAGNPPGAGGTSSATAQIAWMLSYIKGTYGTPEGAWNSEQTKGSY